MSSSSMWKDENKKPVPKTWFGVGLLVALVSSASLWDPRLALDWCKSPAGAAAAAVPGTEVDAKDHQIQKKKNGGSLIMNKKRKKKNNIGKRKKSMMRKNNIGKRKKKKSMMRKKRKKKSGCTNGAAIDQSEIGKRLESNKAHEGRYHEWF